jgi:hypothetical protein
LFHQRGIVSVNADHPIACERSFGGRLGFANGG